MGSWQDERYADSARAHIHASEAAPQRKERELNQAENYARLIADTLLRLQVEEEIRFAR